MGTVVEEGIQCGYHGLVIDGYGRCVRIPGQRLIPEDARVRNYPAVEKDQLVWVWMGDPARADTATIVDFPYHNDPGKWPNKHDCAAARRGRRDGVAGDRPRPARMDDPAAEGEEQPGTRGPPVRPRYRDPRQLAESRNPLRPDDQRGASDFRGLKIEGAAGPAYANPAPHRAR